MTVDSCNALNKYNVFNVFCLVAFSIHLSMSDTCLRQLGISFCTMPIKVLSKKLKPIIFKIYIHSKMMLLIVLKKKFTPIRALYVSSQSQ